MTFWKRQNYGDSKIIRGCQGMDVGRDEQAEHRWFLGQWKYSVWYYDDGHIIIHLSKSTECTTPRVNFNVNYGLWMIMMCSCRFISCNKYATLSGDVDNGGGYAHVGQGGIWEKPVPSSQFCSEPKIALKMQSLIKKF